MGIHTGPSEVLADRLEKPSLDNRSYKVIRLPNELEALIIHDPDTDKASAAVDVNAGSLCDEDDLPGMAHAVEHMLFMGNEKYPKENEYQQYLAAHSGSHNAFTGQTSTNYFFEMAVDSSDSAPQQNGSVAIDGEAKDTRPPFYGALDRFAQFFVSPLFLEDTLDRELRAVDSENKKNLQSDVWRLQQLRRSLSNPKHPNCKFSTGNLQTLRDEPLARGVKIRQEFMRFYDEQYSANRMKLVVLGREPLDQLQLWAEELFGDVPNKGLTLNRWDVPLLTEKELVTEIFVKPGMDSRSLEIMFPYPDEDLLWQSHPGRYISHLIGHEGPGSILASVKAKGWANTLSAGSRTICPGTGVFEISIGLTPEGLEKYQEVTKYVFQYISILHETEPQQWIFDENKRMSEIEFRFKQKSPASSTASNLAGTMQKPFPRDQLLSARSVMREFDPDAIKKGIASLNTDNFRLTVVSQEPLQGDVKREKWYGTEYTIRKIPDDFLRSIKKAAKSTATQRASDLFLPGKNEFIPSRLEVVKKQTDEPLKTPKLIRNDQSVRLWFKKDDQFWVPKASLFLKLRNANTGSTPRNTIIATLYTNLVDDFLSEYAYDAEIAGLGYSIQAGTQGLNVVVSGYNDRMSVLLEKVLNSMRHLEVKDDRFAIIKERVARGLRNRGYIAPYQQIGEYARWLTSENGWINEQLLTELESLTASDIRAFQPLLVDQMHIEALAHGNLYREDALKLLDLAEKVLHCRPLSVSQWPIRRSLIIPKGSNFVYPRTLPDPANVNHAVEYVLQIGEIKDRSRRAKLLLFDQMTDEPAFNRLRTKEQLGYVVFSGAIRDMTTLSYRFIIQSEKTPEYLETRIESFLRAFKKELYEMTPEQFESHRRSKISERLEKIKNLSQEAGRFWTNINNQFYHFEEMEDDAARLKTVTKRDLIEFYDYYIDPSSTTRAKTSVYMRAQSSPADVAAKVSPEEQRSQFLGFIGNLLGASGMQPDMEQLSSRFEKVNISGGDQDGIIAAFGTFLKEDAGLADDQVASAAVQAKVMMGQVLSQMGITTAAAEEPVNELDGDGPLIEPTMIEDVHVFKASMPVSTGATPVKDLAEYEDMGSKL